MLRNTIIGVFLLEEKKLVKNSNIKWLSKLVIFVGVISGIILSACTPDFQGEYADPDKAEIVDDKWNETDSRKTAERLINAALSKSWLDNFKKRNGGKRPVVFVGEVQNRTDEHIDSKALTEFIRDELINSGKVRFVDKGNRDELLKELSYQSSGAVSSESAKKLGRQIGADFMMAGSISSIVASQGGLKTVTYQTNLVLTNIETAEIEFSDKYLIKKRFKRSGSGF